MNVKDVKDTLDVDGRLVSAFKYIFSSSGRLYRYMSSDRKEVKVCITLSLIAAVILTAIPILIGIFIDVIIDDWAGGNIQNETVFKMSAVIIVFMVVWYVLNTNASKRAIILGMTVTRRMRSDINRKVLRLPTKYIDSHPAGEMTALISNDMIYVYRMLSTDLIGCVVYIMMSTIIIVMMVITNLWMGLLFILLMPISIAIAHAVGKRSIKDLRDEKRTIGELNGQVLDTLSNYRLVKTFGLEDVLSRRYEALNEDHRVSFTRAKAISGLIEPSVTVMTNIGYVMAVAMGAVLLMNGMLSKGFFVAFIFYVRAISKPIVSSSSAINSIQAEMVSLNRVMDLIEEEEIPDDSGSEPLDADSIRGDIALEDVRFSYQDDKEVLHGVSFTARSGETTAIIGRTGSGKSTVTNLMLRFYDPDSGEITLDGRDISTIRREDISRVFGSILQKPWVFNGTVMENICFGMDIPKEKAIEAAEITGLSGHVERMSDGYDTVVNEQYLSLIEMKLIALTRILLTDPKIIVMDEATSGLDPRSELQIMGSMKEVMKGRTVILTTHNLRLASKADRIVLMDSGRVLEQGSHEELMSLGGKYFELYLMSE